MTADEKIERINRATGLRFVRYDSETMEFGDYYFDINKVFGVILADIAAGRDSRLDALRGEDRRYALKALGAMC